MDKTELQMSTEKQRNSIGMSANNCKELRPRFWWPLAQCQTAGTLRETTDHNLGEGGHMGAKQDRWRDECSKRGDNEFSSQIGTKSDSTRYSAQ